MGVGGTSTMRASSLLALLLWLSWDIGFDIDYTATPYLSTGFSAGSDYLPGLSFSVGAATDTDSNVYPYLSVGYSYVFYGD
jgi:hypothetical protein